MTQQRMYEYRIYPSNKQTARLYSTFRLCTQLHNELLTFSRETYENTGKSCSLKDYNRFITAFKRINPEYKTVYSQTLQEIGNRLTKAFDNFFRRLKEIKKGKRVKPGYPRYKKLTHSICYPQNNGAFKIIGNKLKVSKIGNIPIVLHRQIIGKIKTLTIKRNRAGRWFAVFCCEVYVPEVNNNGPVVGIDPGLEHIITCSDGNQVEPPRFFKLSEKKLKKEQRRLSRKQKGSKNRKKQRLIVARVHNKIANQREDFLHKLSRELSQKYSAIAIEDTQVADMMSNHLVSKSFQDAGLGTLIRNIEYKVSETGSRLIKVNAAYTTQTCSDCGNVQKLKLSERTYNCESCGMSMSRDINSAINMLTRAGLVRSHAYGDNVRPSTEEANVAEVGTIFDSKESLEAHMLRLWEDVTEKVL